MMQQQKEQENIVMQHANLFEDNKDTQLKRPRTEHHKAR